MKGDEDGTSVLGGLWVSDDSVSLSLESVDLDDESVMESVSTKTTVERNMRSRHETTDAKQEIEAMNTEDEEKNEVVKFLLSASVPFNCIGAPLCQDLWWWGMGSDLMYKVEVTVRTLHMNLMDNWVKESVLIEDAEWSVRNTLRLHVK